MSEYTIHEWGRGWNCNYKSFIFSHLYGGSSSVNRNLKHYLDLIKNGHDYQSSIRCSSVSVFDDQMEGGELFNLQILLWPFLSNNTRLARWYCAHKNPSQVMHYKALKLYYILAYIDKAFTKHLKRGVTELVWVQQFQFRFSDNEWVQG